MGFSCVAEDGDEEMREIVVGDSLVEFCSSFDEVLHGFL